MVAGTNDWVVGEIVVVLYVGYGDGDVVGEVVEEMDAFVVEDDLDLVGAVVVVVVDAAAVDVAVVDVGY